MVVISYYFARDSVQWRLDDAEIKSLLDAWIAALACRELRRVDFSSADSAAAFNDVLLAVADHDIDVLEP